jgi:hypothetical protein
MRYVVVAGGGVALCYYLWAVMTGEEPEGRFGTAAAWLAIALLAAVLWVGVFGNPDLPGNPDHPSNKSGQ